MSNSTSIRQDLHNIVHVYRNSSSIDMCRHLLRSVSICRTSKTYLKQNNTVKQQSPQHSPYMISYIVSYMLSQKQEPTHTRRQIQPGLLDVLFCFRQNPIYNDSMCWQCSVRETLQTLGWGRNRKNSFGKYRITRYCVCRNRMTTSLLDGGPKLLPQLEGDEILFANRIGLATLQFKC